MNDLTTTSNTETELPAIASLPTLKPEAYVTQVFDPFKKQFAKAKRASATVPAYDITTGAGMAVSKELRASFRAVRLAVEAERKARKAPIIEIGKLLDTRAKELISDIEPLEDKYDAEIKAEEQRKEDEKQKKLAEERARIEAIENRIAFIRSSATRHIQMPSETITKAIEHWTLLRLDPADYQEFLEDALNAVNQALIDLETLRVQAVEREQAEAKAKADAIELENLRQANAARELREKEEREQREAEDKAKADAAAKLAADQAKEMADLKAQLAALQKASEPAPLPVEAPAAAVITCIVPATPEQIGAFSEQARTIGIPTISNFRAIEVPEVVAIEAAPATPGPAAYEIVAFVANEYRVTLAQALIWLIAADFAGVDLMPEE